MEEQTTQERPSIGTDRESEDVNPESPGGATGEDEREEMDLSGLDAELEEAGVEGAGKRAAFAFYRTGVITGEPSLEAILSVIDGSPKSDCLNVDGVGPAGYEQLAAVVSEDRSDGDEESAAPIGERERRESPETIRVIERDPGIPEDAVDPEEEEAPPIRPATEREDVRRQRERAKEGSRLIKPVRRRQRSEMMPECPECGSDMIVNGTKRGEQDEKTIRYWKCLARPHDGDHRKQTVHED